MTFYNLDKQFLTPEDFASWLASCPPPSWPDPIVGSAYHNTYKPDELQWCGHESMESMQLHYQNQTPPWDRGPHLFLAVGTKDPANDGIFVMTPPWLPGIHGLNPCNRERYGIEVVGDFQSRPMTDRQLQLLIDCAAILHRYAGIGANIIAHRDCATLAGVFRTCPGQAAYDQKPEIQARLAGLLSGVAPARYNEYSALLGRPAAGRQAVISRFPAPAGGYSEYDIRQQILPRYWSLCLSAGVDPILAIAQLAHETGSMRSFWSQRPQRNPAGIGVTGRHMQSPPANKAGWAYNTDSRRWEQGVSFATWKDDAIVAHVGRLLAYALPAGSETPAQKDLIDRALTYRPLPLVMRGSAPYLRLLGQAYNPTGQGWAKPGRTYGAKIADHANALAGF